jgi:hypothetical protein
MLGGAAGGLTNGLLTCNGDAGCIGKNTLFGTLGGAGGAVLGKVASELADEFSPALAKMFSSRPAVSGSTEGGDGFAVGPHGDMPIPRGVGIESHHGVPSAWMEANVPGYAANDAPAVLMPSEAHNMTRAVYNVWRADMRQQMGGVFDWSQVGEGQARDLAGQMFQAADVPQAIQNQYWQQFNGYLAGLRAAA